MILPGAFWEIVEFRWPTGGSRLITMRWRWVPNTNSSRSEDA